MDNKQIFAKNLENLLNEKDLTKSEFARKMNYPETTVSNWTNGKNYPRIDKIQEMADFFGVNKSDLTEEKESKIEIKNLFKIPEFKKKIPLIGTIAAGEPILANEHIEEYIEINKVVKADFCLRVKGDSMINANINNGDIVFIRQQSDVEDGEIAAVLIEDEATLKRVYKIGDVVQLRAENQSYKPITLNGDKNVQILGKATYKISRVI